MLMMIIRQSRDRLRSVGSQTRRLELPIEEHTRAYIGDYFSLPSGTVKSRLTHIYQKLDVRQREADISIAENYKKASAYRPER